MELTCGGCGTVVDGLGSYPFRCPNFASGDVDHVLVVSWPGCERPEWPTSPAGLPHGYNPFVEFRGLLDCYRRALAIGVPDARYVQIVEGLTERIQALDGHTLGATPITRSSYISELYGFDSTGGVWVKDETSNVAGSHKVRHLVGIMVHLLVSEQAGLTDPHRRPDLAIASCGNAALAAASIRRSGAYWRLATRSTLQTTFVRSPSGSNRKPQTTWENNRWWTNSTRLV